MDRLIEAIQVACISHSGQVDRSGETYILHPLRVMLAQSDMTHRIVAVLHDVVEDNVFWSLGDITVSFGKEIGDAVDALTRREGEPYETFIERCNRNPIARVVKIADIKDNLRPGAESLRPRYEAALAVLEADQ